MTLAWILLSLFLAVPPATAQRDTLLQGMVANTAGEPIEGAVILASVPTARSTRANPLVARSDAEGRFTLRLIDSNPHEVTVEAPGYLGVREKEVNPGGRLRIVLHEGAHSIEGRVFDASSSSPIAGARVRIRQRPSRAASFPENPNLGVIEADTDAKGHFRLDSLRPGSHSLTVTAPGFSRSQQTVRAGESAEFQLFAGTGIYGRVMTPDGDAIAGAWVSVVADGRRGVPSDIERSDAEGRFAMFGLGAGDYRLRVRHPHYAPRIGETIALTEDGDIEQEIVLERGSFITGRLLDDEDRPVDGTVQLKLDGDPGFGAFRDLLFLETGDDGTFRLEGIPTGDHTLVVRAEGFALQTHEVRLSASSGEDLGDLLLETGLTIRGRVLAEDGAPLPNAQIISMSRDRSVMGRAEDDRPEAQSRPDGSFVLAGLRDESYMLIVMAKGFARHMTSAKAGTEDLDITLERGGTVFGIVVGSNDESLSGGRVLARGEGRARIGGSTTVESDGRFTLDELAAGNYVVEINIPGFAPGIVSDVNVEPGKPLDLGTVRLGQGAEIRGTVVDPAGAPVVGARVQVSTPGAMRFLGGQSGDATTGREGRFEISGLSSGPIELVAKHPDFAEGRKTVTIDPAADTLDVSLALSWGGSLEGWVRSPDGTGVAERIVQVKPSSNRRFSRDDEGVTTDANGYFRIDQLPSGTVNVMLFGAAGGARFSLMEREVTIEAGELARVDFVLSRVLVHGRVTRRGAPVAAAEVFFRGKSLSFSMFGGGPRAGSGRSSPGPMSHFARTREDGSYELYVEEPGEYFVQVDGAGGLPSRRVEVPDGSEFLYDLSFTGTSVRGHLLDRETRSGVEGRLFARRKNAGSDVSGGGSGAADRQGRFELELEPGDYDLLVMAEGYARREIPFRVGQDPTPEMEIELRTARTIVGRVLNTLGAPVNGMRVLAALDSTDDGVISQTGFALSRGDGSFQVQDLSNGAYNVIAGDGLQGFAFVAGARAGARELELRLQPGGWANVVVVDETGVPVPEVAVGLYAIGGRRAVSLGMGANTSGSITGENGSAELALPVGAVTLRARKQGFEGTLIVQVRPGERVPAELTLLAKPK